MNDENSQPISDDCEDSQSDSGNEEREANTHVPSDPSPESTHSVKPHSEAMGAQIGPYRLLEELGEGGMGTVYLAEQREPVHRRVALKIIKSGMDTSQVIARFEAERQALAMMDHANIAKVFDAGTTATGRPYFVMELVKGTPITKFCDDNKLGIRARLELFSQVCSAVQHAHQKGIIHRDLKPGNILVTQQDDQPIPKVIDFGLVKAMNQRLTEKTLFTTHGQVLGTFEYMSPEQAQLNEADIDTRSDIYSLGVILYELLAGSTPLRRETLREAGYMEILNRIKEEEPERPSTRISDSIDTLDSISSVRQVEPRKLLAMVKGDLDWIVLKAMEKNRSRRYETANGFASDIRRYLTDEPIEARPPSAGYRMQKLIRKNRVAFGFAATVACMLLVGIGVSSYLAIWATSEAHTARLALQRADDERNKAKQAQVEAETSARRMTAVLEIVTESFQSVDPTLGTHAFDMPASEVLKRAYEQLDTRLADDPLARATLLHTLSRSFFGLGEIKMSLSAAEEAVRIRTAELGERDPETLSSMHELFRAYQMSGDKDRAVEQGARALKLCRVVLGEDHLDTLTLMTELAFVYIAKDDLDKSISLQEEALAKWKKYLGDDHPGTILSMGWLHSAYYARGDFGLDKAISLFEQVLARQKLSMREDHPEILKTMGRLDSSYELKGDFCKAITLYEQKLAGLKRTQGENHPKTLDALDKAIEAINHAIKNCKDEKVLASLKNKLKNFQNKKSAQAKDSGAKGKSKSTDPTP